MTIQEIEELVKNENKYFKEKVTSLMLSIIDVLIDIRLQLKRINKRIDEVEDK